MVPADTPVRTPVEEPIVATDGTALDQTPLAVVLVNVTASSAQTEDGPLIALTDVGVDTVTMRVAVQPPDVV